MPNASSVCLNSDLNKSFTLLLADRLDSENRRVGMRSDHSNGVARLVHYVSIPGLVTCVDRTYTFHFLPMANAIRVDPLRVRKYFPPGWRVDAHGSLSW